MGRRFYLERLALGRSPFQDADPIEPLVGDESKDAQPEPGPAERDGVPFEQQYDNKGRPTNPATEKRNQDMRNAQNAILSLVGVVESKEQSMEQFYEKIRKQRELVLIHEQDRGEDLDIVVKGLHAVLTWFPATLIHRTQAGVYPFSVPFADVFLRELSRVRGGGFWRPLHVLYPGFLTKIICGLAEMLLYSGTAEIMSRIETEVMKRFKRRKNLKRLSAIVNSICEVLFIGIDIVLLPLKYHSYAQMLGLAPTWPLFPSWRVLRLDDPRSYHNFIWIPLIQEGPLKHVSSPALLLLIWTLVNRNHDDEYPIVNQLTDFTYPPANTSPLTRDVFVPGSQNPLSKLFHQLYLARQTIMTWFGYSLHAVSPRTGEHFHAPHACNFDTSNTQLARQPRSHIWRSTALAVLPARFLAERIDAFFSRLLTLGLESTVLRAITSSYLASSLPRTSLAVEALRNYTIASSTLLAPFGAWPLNRAYLSRLGLSIALYCTAEAGIFFIVHGLARWQGLRNFYWDNQVSGTSGFMGKATDIKEIVEIEGEGEEEQGTE